MLSLLKVYVKQRTLYLLLYHLSTKVKKRVYYT